MQAKRMARFSSLDVARGIAALCVAVDHVASSIWSQMLGSCTTSSISESSAKRYFLDQRVRYTVLIRP